jgi:hypothetical protein
MDSSEGRLAGLIYTRDKLAAALCDDPSDRDLPALSRDLIGIGLASYLGSPSIRAKELINADLAEHRLDFTVRKEILWESDSATDAEARAIEVKLIRETGANNPAIGYNLTPRWSE